MRRLMTAAALALGLTLSLAVEANADESSGAIQTVIQNQFEAFQADDFETAFEFASPGIQRMFGTPQRFGEMVRQGYPMVWRPSSVEFTALDERAGRMYQNVLITDGAGTLHLLEYEMLRTEDGWEINGVQFKRPGAFGA